MVSDTNSFFSIWAQDAPYWLIVEGSVAAALPEFAAIYHKPNLAALKTSADWVGAWQQCTRHLVKLNAIPRAYRAAVIPSDEMPSLQEIMMALKPIGEIDLIASNLWLMEYVIHGQIDCYMQKVMDRRDKLGGYEAFVRIEGKDGGIIGGGAIMQAAHALRVEYQLDRLLHKQAIECFVDNQLDGYIFINFLTGFIHRPEVYLEGLSQTVTRTHMRPGSVVLDVPLHDYTKDMQRLKSIAQYCRSRGFSLALDDIASSEGLAALLSDIRPAFVKIHGNYAEGMSAARAQGVLHEIVRICHANGVSVLAEGVETKAQHELYLAADVDMFQGYLFAPPERFPRVAAATSKVNVS